jgi:PAS domain S-box-containing protein
MPKSLNILVIEDSNADFLMVERHLKKNDLQARCSRVDSLEGLQEAIDRESWDLVLSDYNIPQLNFRDSLNLLNAALPDLPVILVSGTVGEEKAVDLLKLGIRDFVLKDNLTRLVSAIERSLKEASELKAKLASDLALQKSEIRFRSIFNKSPVAIGIGKTDNGLLIDVNDAWLKLYGYERDEMIGRTTTELNLYDMPGERGEIIRSISECGTVVNREVRLRTKTGENFIVLYSAEIVELNGESFLQVMLTDITEQKRKEMALRESEDMYRSLFDNMLNGFALCRMIFDGDTPKDFIYLSVNDAFEKQTGLKDVVGRRVTEVIPGIRESDPVLFEVYGRVALTGNPEQLETYVEALEQWYWISVYSPSREHFVAVFDVITERKLAEKALAKSEERFQLAMRGTDEGLWDWNMKLDEMYYAPRWKTMLGYADEELDNHLDTWKRLLHPEDLETVMVIVRDFLKGRAANFEIEVRMRHNEGHYLNILSRGFPIYDDLGVAVRVVGTNVDITERKRLEEQYRQAQKMEAVGQLAGGVAHDFNNILSAILGYSHLILNLVKENDPIQKHVEQIISASERAAALTQGLLAFSRKQAVTLAIIDLNDVISGFEEFIRRLIREDIELKLNCIGEPLPVLADCGQIEQVIMNLVANARDAMPNGGKLIIETLPVTLDREFIETHGYGKAGEYAQFSVSDSGEGMDRETLLHIFEPFFTTKEQGKGTGLGLSMAYGIIKKHDGFINVYSEPGTGTIFKIYLPRVRGAVEAGKKEPREESPLRGGAETILVGEDDETLRRLSRRVLSHYGYRVIEAVDGQDAVDKFVEYGDSIQLVILDAIMPKKNGKEAYDEMKRLRPDLKAVFVSGYTSDIFEEDTTFDETNVFIQKPYSPNVLTAKVRELLDKK